jgi:hypothetical protein
MNTGGDMRCRLHFYPNVLQVHIDRELTKKYSVNFHSEDCACPEEKDRPSFITKLLQMNGVKMVQIDKYTVYISKGEVFNWEELLESIMNIFLYEFALDSEINFVEPHLEYVMNLATNLYDKRIKNIKLPNPYKLSVRERKNGKEKPKE